MVGGLIGFWNAWAIHFLVLWSLALQVVLLSLAGIRRRDTSWRVFSFFLWLAYQLADAAAIYALGHLSRDEHQRLVAFWAPFLLLHLGGPDNITAYALEDNRLWLRHLLSLVLQVLGAAYVLYKNYIGTVDFLLLAAVLMFAVGFVKYGERTWALWSSNMGSIRNSIKKARRPRCHDYLEDEPPPGGFKGKVEEEEFLMRHAHSLFHICKSAMVESSEDVDLENPEISVLRKLRYDQKYAVMELELSLMYDILYTKAAVVHTLIGYCICVGSVSATAAAFLLFQFSGKDGHSRIDVAVTYVLLGGALLMETRSLLSALGSCWTLPFLCGTRWRWLQHEILCSGRWDRLRHWILSLHWLVHSMGLSTYLRPTRRWSGEVGQYNMLQLCSRPGKNKTPWNSPLAGRLVKSLGFEEWWYREYHSGTVNIREDVKERLSRYIGTLADRRKLSTQGIVRYKWGLQALIDCGLDKHLHEWLGDEFQEGIIIWHIATDIFVDGGSGGKKGKVTVPLREDEEPQVENAVRSLSNYMMFLLVKHPYMLPGLSYSKLYRRTCKNLEKIWCEDERAPPSANLFRQVKNLFRLHSSSSDPAKKELAKILQDLHERNLILSNSRTPRLAFATAVAKGLFLNDEDEKRKRDSLEALYWVWVDFLVYAGSRCSMESHAKKLSSGGELTTVLWLLTEHHRQLARHEAQKQRLLISRHGS